MAAPPTTGQRGPAEHDRREQIIVAAREHFQRYGYQKTTVAELAQAIGLSKAYIYKFFESKQAIGEAICASCLAEIAAEARGIGMEGKPAADRLRRIFRSLANRSAELFFEDRKLHDLAATSSNEDWQSTRNYQAVLTDIIRHVLRDGREAGEFERKTPFEEACRAVMLCLEPFQNPLMLRLKLDTLDDDAMLVANLVLRSLSR